MSAIATIQDSSITGFYLGQFRRDTRRWEPYARMLKVDGSDGGDASKTGGYIAHFTHNYPEIVERYPGYADLLLLDEIDRVYSYMPRIFDDRMPPRRKDTQLDCEFLGLDYGELDEFAFVARTGGYVTKDSFSVCPIVKPNEWGKYVFYTCLDGLDGNQWARTVWSEISSRKGEFVWENINGQLTLKFNGDILGKLFPYFELLDGNIVDIEIVNFTRPETLQGFGILLRVTMESGNPYTHELFEPYVETVG
jgi:hypothetical protein